MEKIERLIDDYGKAVREAERSCFRKTFDGEFTQLLNEVARIRRALDSAIREMYFAATRRGS